MLREAAKVVLEMILRHGADQDASLAPYVRVAQMKNLVSTGD